jgi:sugar diacid utilization regulator
MPGWPARQSSVLGTRCSSLGPSDQHSALPPCAELVRTLSVYLHHLGSHKKSARMLHLHTNTVAYRVARIEAITGLYLGDPDDQLVSHVAVKIIGSQGSADISG